MEVIGMMLKAASSSIFMPKVVLIAGFQLSAGQDPRALVAGSLATDWYTGPLLFNIYSD